MDNEDNRFSARAARYLKVGSNVGAVAAKVAGQRLFGMQTDNNRNASELAAALGGLKGPMMKVAQLLSTIPEALPPEYALGNLELFLSAAQALDDRELRVESAQLAAGVVASIEQHGWLCGTPQGAETLGLMTGLAGIGYMLLRVANPEEVPAVLTLATPG